MNSISILPCRCSTHCAIRCNCTALNLAADWGNAARADLMIKLTVNGIEHELDIDPSMPLLYALRNPLQLHGAKFGCGLGQCGACTVIVDDRAVFSCLLPVSAIGNRRVRTIESLGTGDKPGKLQQAFIDHQAAQCGYCIAGMIMRATALLEKTPHPTE